MRHLRFDWSTFVGPAIGFGFGTGLYRWLVIVSGSWNMNSDCVMALGLLLRTLRVAEMP
jgi:hypothetical protein